MDFANSARVESFDDKINTFHGDPRPSLCMHVAVDLESTSRQFSHREANSIAPPDSDKLLLLKNLLL